MTPINTLLAELETLNNQYKTGILQESFVNTKPYYELLKNMEAIKIKLAQLEPAKTEIYPSIYRTDLTERITKKREFGIYKIPHRDTGIPADTANLQVFKHTPSQKFLRNFMSDKTPYRGLLIIFGTGVGKCHSANTKILMADGTIKAVQDLVVGDLLMGDDSTPRTVLSLASGYDKMYEITPINPTFRPYRVNSEHILCLKGSANSENIVEISVNRYLEVPDEVKLAWRGYRQPIENFNCPNKITHNAYSSGYCSVSTSDGMLASSLINRIKFQPIKYRRQYLAGFIDAYYMNSANYASLGNEVYDGRSITLDISAFNYTVDYRNSMRLLVLSIGLGIREYGIHGQYRITGNLQTLPCERINLKRHLTLENEQETAITVKQVAEKEKYYGMTLDGNGRYMLADDLTITHNTCSAITIAEQFKRLVYKNDKKIYIIRAEEFQQQLFDVNKVANGMVDSQCTGSDYLAEVENPEIIANCRDKRACEGLQMKLTKIIKKYYDFYNIETWARAVGKLIYKKGKPTPQEAHEYKVRQIRRYFSDTLIIIDEAHHINDETNARTISRVLADVLQYSENLRLIMLTATPMFDKPEDIITILNYLLINDKRPRINQSIFDIAGMLTDAGRQILIDKSRGYISYLRGNNPFDFPMRLNARVNLPMGDFLKLGKSYPAIPEEFQNIRHHMKFLDIIDCPMSKQQKAVYNSIVKTSAAWSEESQISNFIYQSIEESGSNNKHCYGDGGFSQVVKSKSNPPYQFHDPEYAKRFLNPALGQYSSKIAKIIDIIKNASGPVFIFTQWISGGLYPLIMALEMNGYRGYKGASFLENPYKSPDNMGEYIVKSGSYNTPHLQKYISKRENMVNEPVRVFIATASASEGINLFGYREAHILDPHFNLSRIEQAIGRTIRYKSHLMLPPQMRNVVVYMYSATLPKVETVDLYKYRISELKAITTGQVEKILKENAVDCILNKEGNSISKADYPMPVEMLSSQNKKVMMPLYDQPFSRACNYMESCEFKCMGVNSERIGELDASSIRYRNLEKDVQYIEKTATKLIAKYNIIHVDDLREILQISDSLIDDAFMLAIYKIVDSAKPVISPDGSSGKIVKYGDYMKFIPDYYKDEDIEFQFQYKPLKARITDLDLRNYISKLKKFRDAVIENKESNYDILIKDLEDVVGSIIHNTVKKEYEFTNSIKLLEQEIVDFVLQRYLYQAKVEIITTLFRYLVGKTSQESPTSFELLVLDYIRRFHIIYYSDIYPDRKMESQQIYGIVIAKGSNIETYVYNEAQDQLVKELAVNKKFIDNKKRELEKTVINNVFGYLSSDKVDYSPSFKIIDKSIDNKKVNKGGKCIDKNKNEIMKYIRHVNNIKLNQIDSKTAICGTFELILRRYDKTQFNKFRWFLSPEEHLILNHRG
jgi:hypothetical protein